MKRVDIITPVFNETGNLERYVETVRERLVAAEPGYRFQVIFVDDGSSDGSWPMIQKLAAANPWITGVRLSRNFGAHYALTAGFFESTGDAVITLACDLQDPPEVGREFLRGWENGKAIVWGHRAARQDAAWRIWASGLFLWFVKRSLPRNSQFTTGSFFLADRAVRECFKQFGESRRLTFALVAWTGFEQGTVSYERRRRESGRSGWTFAKMLSSLYDAVIAYSDWPAKFMTWLGVGMCVLSFVFLGYTVLHWLGGDPMRGWTSLATLISGFHGISFLIFGLMAQYLSRIYGEVVRRPLYFVSDRTEAR